MKWMMQIPSRPKVMHHIMHFVWQYVAVANHPDAKNRGAKNAICLF